MSLKVLHYRSRFLNPSETFIARLLHNHQKFEPVAACMQKKEYTSGLKVQEAPQKGISAVANTVCYKLNLSPPFIYDLVKKEMPDVIHAHFGLDGYRMIRLARSKKLPLIISFYGSDVTRLPNEFGWKKRYRKLAKLGDAFIVVSKKMRKQLIELGFPRNKIKISYFGVDEEQFVFRQNYQFADTVMMVGRMVEKKGYETALNAIGILKEQGVTLKMNLYGDGPLKSSLQQLSLDLNIQDHISFHGAVDNETVRKAHHVNGLLLAPSVVAADGDQEGLPNTILEAMASGIPIVATNHTAIPEAIINEKTGLLVPERNPDELALALTKLRDNQELANKLRANARKFILEKPFTVKNMVAQTEAIYSECIAAFQKQE